MLGSHIGQSLQAVNFGQIAAEPLHGLVVPAAGSIAALAVMAVKHVQLSQQISIDGFIAHGVPPGQRPEDISAALFCLGRSLCCNNNGYSGEKEDIYLQGHISFLHVS